MEVRALIGKRIRTENATLSTQMDERTPRGVQKGEV